MMFQLSQESIFILRVIGFNNQLSVGEVNFLWWFLYGQGHFSVTVRQVCKVTKFKLFFFFKCLLVICSLEFSRSPVISTAVGLWNM